MSKETAERLEDDVFRLFESLREKGLRRAAVGLVIDLLNAMIVHEGPKPGGVMPKTAESIERSLLARRRAVRSIVNFLQLRAEEKPELNLDQTVRTRTGAELMLAEADEASDLLEDIGRQCARYVDDAMKAGTGNTDRSVVLHVMRNAIGNDDLLKRHISF